MKYLYLCAFTLLTLSLTAPANAAERGLQGPADPSGLWLTEDGKTIVKVDECRDTLCGNVVWIEEGVSRRNNHGAGLCGFQAMYGFKKDAQYEWENGRVFETSKGTFYKAQLELKDSDTLQIKPDVAVPLFTKGVTWTRVKNAKDYIYCGSPNAG